MARVKPIVAIDGPAGSGKSTLAKLAAKSLEFIHIDTGPLYRSVAWLATTKNLGKADASAISDLAKSATIEFKAVDGNNRVVVNGQDVSADIRTEAVSKMASVVSAIPDVRASLLDQQRRMGNAGAAVMEGRDIGTVVFPDAEVKIFLTASDEERAKRRLAELQGRGEAIDFETVLRDLRERDKNDSERDIAPLKKADDAIELDTTGLVIDEVLEKIVEIVHDYEGKTNS